MSRITPRIACELIDHEAIVQEAYLDSEGIWTWGIGVTDASGHKVGRYKDNPQSIARCIEIYLWLLETKYLPPVLAAFGGYDLAEHELGAALSFHYNTGRIASTDWVKLVKQSKTAEARTFLETHYLNDGDLTSRRLAEADLFFHGAWSGTGKTTVWPVKKPSYKPDWRGGKRVDITPVVEQMLGGR